MDNTKKKLITWEDISLYRNELYGFSILWIMFFHAIAILGLDYKFGVSWMEPLNYAINCGNIGCEVFLFCSGICLYFSYVKDSNLLRFLSKRITRVFLPILIISGPYWIWTWLIKEHNIGKFIQKMTMMDFWFSGDQQIWFVSLILVCYFLYPYIYAVLFESKHSKTWIRLICMLAGVMVLTLSFRDAYPESYDKIEIALTRIPIFIIGCYFGKHVYEKRQLPNYTWVLVLIADVIVYVVLYERLVSDVWKRWLFMFGGVSITFSLILVLKLLRWSWFEKVLRFFGGMSINLYISHIILIRLYKMTVWYDNCRLLHYGIVMIISVLVAWVSQKIITLILKKPN